MARPPSRPREGPGAGAAVAPARPAPLSPPSQPGGAITLAVITGAHGVTGEVRLKVFAENLSAHRHFNGGALTLTSLRDGGNGAIGRFAEISDRTAAETMRGIALTVARDALPPLGEGEYYHADLIGLAVTTTDGQAIGRVVAVENFGAGDVVEIARDAGGRRFMVPMNAEAVPHWDRSGLVIADGWADA